MSTSVGKKDIYPYSGLLTIMGGVDSKTPSLPFVVAVHRVPRASSPRVALMPGPRDDQSGSPAITS